MNSETYPSPFVVMGVGIQGAGKSTILRPLAMETGAHYLCADDIRENITGDASDQTVNAEAWDALYEKAQIHLGEGDSLVVDGIHASSYYRQEGVRKYRSFGARAVIALCIEVDVNTALRRIKKREADGGRFVPDEVVHATYRALRKNPVHKNDGFDDIIRLTP
jgi:predicted kinase